MRFTRVFSNSRRILGSTFSLTAVSGIIAYNYFYHFNSELTEEQRIKLCLDKLRTFNEQLKLKADIDENPIMTAENSDPESIAQYSQANHSYHKGVTPIAIFYPTSTEEVVQMVKICNELSIPITAFGTGTNLEGSVVPLKRCVIIDFEKMNNVKKLYKDDFQITVEPGVQWMQLNEELQKVGLFFPMDPGPGASLGGMINTNCSGTNAVKYGTMKDWIVNLTVVLSDGRVIKTANRAKKSSAGYNLNSLFCGSEGTLGIVTEATLKLAPYEKDYAVFNIAFDDISDAITSCTQIIQAGIQTSALEFLDDEQIKANNACSKVKFLEKQNLLIKVTGSYIHRKEVIDQILEITKKNHGMEPNYALNTKEAEQIWLVRRRSLWATQKLRPGSKIYITDVCVPISYLPISLKEVKEDIKKTGIVATIVGHVGDGNYHLFICIDHENKEEFKKVEDLHKRLVKRALELEGTCTGEHGIGIGKRKFLLEEKSEETIKFMKQLKHLIDPKGIYNPGKIFFLDE